MAGLITSSDPIVTIRADGPDLEPARHGAKAVGLQRLLRHGLPVPAGFVIPITTAARLAAGQRLTSELDGALDRLGLGASQQLAVRSGSPDSLPGALISVLGVERVDVVSALVTVVQSTQSPHVASLARRLGYPEPVQTAVVVQHHLDPTVDDRSGAGVATSCDPLDGRPGVVGSMAWRQPGADVMAAAVPVAPLAELAQRLPAVFGRLIDDVTRIAEVEHSPVEVEFAVVAGQLQYLQLRRFAVVQSAAAESEAMVEFGRGQPGSSGQGVGCLMVDGDDALDAIERGVPVVLALPSTSPADVPAIVAATGLITVRGGRDSHAAVVARSVGVPAVLGVAGLTIDPEGIVINGRRVLVGEQLVVDGSGGRVGQLDPGIVPPVTKPEDG